MTHVERLVLETPAALRRYLQSLPAPWYALAEPGTGGHRLFLAEHEWVAGPDPVRVVREALRGALAAWSFTWDPPDEDTDGEWDLEGYPFDWLPVGFRPRDEHLTRAELEAELVESLAQELDGYDGFFALTSGDDWEALLEGWGENAGE